MAHTKKHGNPVPPGNQPITESDANLPAQKPQQSAAEVTSAQEQDEKRRLGDFTGKGEHSIQQPGGRNDANHHGG